MGATVTELLAEADRLLTPERFEDYCVNGLQVPGAEQVQTIASGVSANAELFRLAADGGAELLLVHHGLFWGPGVRSIDQALRIRLKILLDADMALAAYHLPLDAHPELGNNALIGRALGAERLEPFGRHRDRTLGFMAQLPGFGVPVDELVEQVHGLTSREPLLLGAGPAVVRRLAIISGAGSDYAEEAARSGADALLTGEPAERVTATATELGIHLIAAGHHATERFGIRRLGDHLAERFALRHLFLDVANPV